MLKGSHCCTSGLSFIAGASPRTVGVAAAGAAGVWRAVPWIPEPGQAGRGAPGCPLSSHGEFISEQSPSQLPSSQPIPAAPPGVLGSPLPPPRPFSSCPSSLPATSIHLPSPGFVGVLSPYIPSMPDIASTLPCPMSRRAGIAGVAFGRSEEEPHGELDPQS